MAADRNGPLRNGRRGRRDDEPRARRLNLTLGDDEHQALVAAAAEAGLSVGAYAAQAAVAVARNQITPAPNDERERLVELANARVELRRIGTNLNQLAARANAGAPVPAAQLDAVLARVERAVIRVDDASLAAMEVLGRRRRRRSQSPAAPPSTPA
ncbi:plasmid mobilization protein [Streptomyces sp. URMC 129]|uniref:plasmid mobilization protein n=1 Tax=Streptomyces sp. URMC 129 TaxID=3423407 RepID=UPI003F1DC53B